MTTDPPRLPKLMDRQPLDLRWEVVSLRCSLFTADAAVVAEGLWKKFTDQDPETVESRLQQSVRNEKGSWGSGFLEVVYVPGRVDIVLAKPLGVDDEGSMAFALGEWEAVREGFCDRCKNILREWHVPTIRIAFAGTLLSEVSSVEAGYETLAKCLAAMQVDPKKMRDVRYRVNWLTPTTATTSGHFNRLTTWTVRTMTLSVGQSNDVSKLGPVAKRYFISVDLDMNTPGENEAAILEKDLPELFDMLVDAAQGNARFGEVPS